VKKLIYTKSPKEIASEYLHSSRQQSQQSQQSHQKSKSTHSPQRSKNYPYPFNLVSIEKKIEEEHEDFNVTSNNQKSPGKPSAFTELSNKLFTQRMYGSANGKRTVMTKEQKDLLLSAKAVSQIEEKREITKSDQEQHVGRLLELGKVMGDHSKALADAYLQKEMEECTFHPTIHSKPQDLKGFDNFLEDQKKFLEQKEHARLKLQEEALQQQIANEGPYKPEVCKGSRKINEKKKERGEEEISVHHRLYKVSRNSHAKHLQGVKNDQEFDDDTSSQASSQFIGPISADSNGVVVNKSRHTKEEPTFQPNIHKKSKNIKRDKKVGDILYYDALRRKTKSIEASKMADKSVKKSKMSQASKRALATRFIREFDLAIVEFLEVGKPPMLDYVQLSEFLTKMRFLKEPISFDAPQSTPEKVLLYDMWYNLQADKYKGVHRRNLLVFVLAIMGLYYQITKIQKQDENAEGSVSESAEKNHEEHPNFINPTLPEGSGRERVNIGSFDDDGNFELSEEDVKKIHKFYDLWERSRLCAPDNLGQVVSARRIEEVISIPEINETSRAIAQNYREKILEGTAELIQQNKIIPPKDGKITHVDLLMLSKKVTQEKIEKKAELQREKEFEDCTFKPQTLEYVAEGKSKHDSQLENSTEHPRKTNVMPATSLGRNRRVESAFFHFFLEISICQCFTMISHNFS